MVEEKSGDFEDVSHTVQKTRKIQVETGDIQLKTGKIQLETEVEIQLKTRALELKNRSSTRVRRDCIQDTKD